MNAILNGFTWEFLWKAVKYYFIAVLVLVAGNFIYAHSPYSLTYNASYSLPYTVVIVEKSNPKMTWEYGDLMAFQWQERTETPLYSPDWTALKVVTAQAGDRIIIHSDHRLEAVTTKGRQTFEVLPHNRFGKVLHILDQVGKDGIIPYGHYFVTTPHTRSYDSRYAEVGLISAARIVGKGVWVW